MADVAPVVEKALPGMPESRWITLGGPPAPGAADRRTHWVDFGGPPGAAGAGAGAGRPMVPTIVCVHGLGGGVVDWMRVAPPLTAVARVVALDFVGHGRTPALGRPATMAAHRAQLEAFLREVVGGPAVLVGNSMGGIASLLVAATTPSLVRGLVLVDPALPVPRRSAPDPFVAAAFAAYLVPGFGEWIAAQRRRRLPPETMVRQTLALCTTHPDRVPDEMMAAYIALNIEQSNRGGVSAAFLASARSLLSLMIARPRRLSAAMRSAPGRTLLLHGARDRLVPLRSARTALALRPDWDLEVHPDAGHIPMIEEPAWTVEKILAWLPTAVPGPWPAGAGAARAGAAAERPEPPGRDRTYAP